MIHFESHLLLRLSTNFFCSSSIYFSATLTRFKTCTIDHSFQIQYKGVFEVPPWLYNDQFFCLSKLSYFEVILWTVCFIIYCSVILYLASCFYLSFSFDQFNFWILYNTYYHSFLDKLHKKWISLQLGFSIIWA